MAAEAVKVAAPVAPAKETLMERLTAPTPAAKHLVGGLIGLGIGVAVAHFAKQSLIYGAGIGLAVGLGATYIHHTATTPAVVAAKPATPAAK